MYKHLTGKVALITGGSRGIGRAIAYKLAQEGCHVAINYYNSSDEAEKLCEELRHFNVQAYPIQCNVADPTSVKEMGVIFREHFMRLDILVNNAASGVLKPLLSMSLKHWRWCMEINALGLVLITQEFKSLFQQGGRVFALSSIGANRMIPDYGFIGASKAALESLIRSLTVELAPLGVSANTISAGLVDTDALKHFPRREKLIKESLSRSLTGRLLNPEDIANVIFLLSLPEANMIKGQTIVVDDGYSIIG